MPEEERDASYYKKTTDLDDNAVVSLIEAMFQLLKSDYVFATDYVEKHRNEKDSKPYINALKLKRECERFVQSPLYHSITDYDGKSLLRSFRKVG